MFSSQAEDQDQTEAGLCVDFSQEQEECRKVTEWCSNTDAENAGVCLYAVTQNSAKVIFQYGASDHVLSALDF